MEFNIHDNFVYAISIHLERREIVLHTEFRDDPGPKELTDIKFTDVLVHHFLDAIHPSVLLDIEQTAPEWIVQDWQELFERGKNYGWPPLEHRDLDELRSKLHEQGYSGFRVMGSCGLDGFVIARQVECLPRNERLRDM